MRRQRSRTNHGFTLPEFAVIMAVIGVLVAFGVTSFSRWSTDQRAAVVARSVADAMTLARSEAIRTGDVQIVFLAIGGAGDAGGNPLRDRLGNPVPLLILDDGAVGSANQNCRIDAGEATQTLDPVPGISWGFTLSGGVKAPGDGSPSPTATGSSFSSPAGANTTWVAFMPDGVPVGFNAACNLGTLGSGNGGIYITNGTRDYAAVMNPLGSVRVHAWDAVNGQWRN